MPHSDMRHPDIAVGKMEGAPNLGICALWSTPVCNAPYKVQICGACRCNYHVFTLRLDFDGARVIGGRPFCRPLPLWWGKPAGGWKAVYTMRPCRRSWPQDRRFAISVTSCCVVTWTHRVAGRCLIFCFRALVSCQNYGNSNERSLLTCFLRFVCRKFDIKF